MHPELAPGPVLVWRLPSPLLTISSGALGGGIGERRWVINATVPHGYDRDDPDVHLAELAAALDLTGPGTGFLTAVDVREVATAADSGVLAHVTAGIGAHPTWAAAPDAAVAAPSVGTINAVCFLPVRLSDAALVNAVATVAEAKAQALAEAGVPGTGTSTDATALLCPVDGEPEAYGGPRSRVGSALARAAHTAIHTALRA
ncbi:adenosylcobinamide amidohydrolase [Actinophytocola gossypii]|uniref:Adenosylcobinamide amidohydrolase n=1 Tax=Actinophytocola gossypii TaxID=2812003 RepID=A0ABT2JE91_9PSEU|nr:adenosylcobinamide amidohydrolase [Actinophytocola gossypii]MCT2586198.1 adenosylcobinamide amidohydrolase [Actinophytocola gossypii]